MAKKKLSSSIAVKNHLSSAMMSVFTEVDADPICFSY